jgi:alpha-tubulin suppressor-like RCC1 family protein
MALTDAGCVYGWGTFRDAGGVFGFAPGTRIQLTPTLVYRPVAPDARISRIASGGAALSRCSSRAFCRACGGGKVLGYLVPG